MNKDSWNLCCMFTETSTTATSATVAAASIYIPPWPGGLTSQALSELFTPLFQNVNASLNVVEIRCNVVAPLL